jgi:ankyrin repeat protein
MKKIISATFTVFASAGLMFAATNDLTSLIQKGLFEEEANHNLAAAMRAYQAAVDGFDKDRQLDATAVFRLGECWRKLGKTNEANLQYQRVLREFPDQTNLTKLCSEYLGGASATVPSEAAPDVKAQEIETAYNNLKVKWALIEGELAMVTNMSRTDMENYFTTVKPDDALKAFEVASASAEADLNQITKSGFGPQSGEVLARKSNLDLYKREAAERVDALVRMLQLEADLLNQQSVSLRSLPNQSNLSAPVVAASTIPAPSAEDEEVRKIKEMIKNSPDLINGPGPDGGMTPLQMAVSDGNVTAAELLLANGAETGGTSRSIITTPLGMAADRGNKAMLELLLAKGADVNAADRGNSEQTPLHHAAAKGFKTVVEFLLAHKADVNARDRDSSTPLHVAARSGFRSVAELLITNQADVNARNKQASETPLFAAVAGNHLDLVQLLLANKAEVNAADKQGDAPLLEAVRRNQPEMAQILLAHKADVNTRNNQGWSPLFDAVNNNRTELVQLLLAGKADVNAAFKPGVTSLLLACSKSDIDLGLVKSLLQNGADTQAHIPDDGNSYNNISPGRHALDIALQTGRTNVLELLLASHADPNATSPWSAKTYSPMPPLIWTEMAMNNYPNAAESFKILLDHGADPDLADYNGKTPMILAVREGKIELIQELLDHHADVNKPDNDGKPPLAYVPTDNPQGPPGMGWQPGLPLQPAVIPGMATTPRGAVGPGADHQPVGATIKALLLKAGANEDFQRLGRIFITQKGTGSIGREIFRKDADSLNHYTLLELVAEVYQGSGKGAIAFPDLAHVIINRLKTGGAKEEIAVNLDEILSSGDCAKDPSLEWGDIVQIAQLDHLVNEDWSFSDEMRTNLANCLARKVEIIVKGQTTNLKLISPIATSYARFKAQAIGGHWMDNKSTIEYQMGEGRARFNAPSNPPTPALETFYLKSVVHQANVLLLSSDLTRAKVTRNGAPMTFNLEPASTPDFFWLRDGDIIEIPERDADAPATK